VFSGCVAVQQFYKHVSMRNTHFILVEHLPCTVQNGMARFRLVNEIENTTNSNGVFLLLDRHMTRSSETSLGH
jgi:hypothetical protein